MSIIFKAVEAVSYTHLDVYKRQLNNYALSKVQASIISALSGLTTVNTIITGVLFNNEVLYWYHIAGTILILIGIIGMSYASSKKRLR